MKKILLAVGVALTITTFSACSNEENVKMEEITTVNSIQALPQSDIVELEYLHNQIVDYNQKYEEVQPQTRGFWRRFWQGVATVLADAIGATGGGIAGAGVCSGLVGAAVYGLDLDLSIKAVLNIQHAPVNNPNIAFNNVVIPGSTSREYVNTICPDSIGYYHNAILYDFFSDSTKYEQFEGIGQHKFAGLIIDKISDFSPIQVTDEEVDLHVHISNIIISALKNSETYEDFCNTINSSLPIDKNILLLLEEYVKGLETIDSQKDNSTYLKDMLKIIQDSDLSKGTKERLEDAVIVGNASNKMWNTFDDKIEEPNMQTE